MATTAVDMKPPILKFGRVQVLGTRRTVTLECKSAWFDSTLSHHKLEYETSVENKSVPRTREVSSNYLVSGAVVYGNRTYRFSPCRARFESVSPYQYAWSDTALDFT